MANYLKRALVDYDESDASDDENLVQSDSDNSIEDDSDVYEGDDDSDENGDDEENVPYIPPAKHGRPDTTNKRGMLIALLKLL